MTPPSDWSCDEPPKKCDATIVYLQVLRKADIRSGTLPKADYSEITFGEPQASRVTFLEDFTLEHSLNDMRVTLIEIAGIF
jgi:hypothetical protein